METSLRERWICSPTMLLLLSWWRSVLFIKILILGKRTLNEIRLSQILNEELLKSTCEGSQLCVIGVLPHILDTGEKRSRTRRRFLLPPQLTVCCSSAGAAGRNGYLEVMIKMAEKYKKKMWG